VAMTDNLAQSLKVLSRPAPLDAGFRRHDA
jgi:hypothetical protein